MRKTADTGLTQGKQNRQTDQENVTHRLKQTGTN